MGYEIKLYVVDKRDKFSIFEDEAGRTWCEVIAMFNYCKDYALHDFILRNSKEATCYFYDTDGDTAVTQDLYGKPLREIELETLIKYFEENPDTSYRRYKSCVALLKSFQENIQDWSNLVVLSFGY